jgi:hypothetical protein
MSTTYHSAAHLHADAIRAAYRDPAPRPEKLPISERARPRPAQRLRLVRIS